MNRSLGKFAWSVIVALASGFAPQFAWAFDSGSTGADGALNPTVNTVLQVPPSGVFNFTSVNIPAGVTVSFKKNVSNTPITILASGDVTIAGTLHVNGGWSTAVGAASDGNPGDDGLPGLGGPGGYDGGSGGVVGSTERGGNGYGPGAGAGGWYSCTPTLCQKYGGGGAGFATAGVDGSSCVSNSAGPGVGGSGYGSIILLPLIGGSGGGGGDAGSIFRGSGGGGGGGALLIAASGTVTITGSISANGGNSGTSSGAADIPTGGGGSGGAIRIVATQITGNGSINAAGGQAGLPPTTNQCYFVGGNGSPGRIRLEAEIYTRTAGTTPSFTFGTPSSVFVAGLPTLRIDSVAGVQAPAEPTGNADIVLPTTTANPVTVVLKTTSVPVGNTVKVTVTPSFGAATSTISPALTGTTASASTSVSTNLPTGPSVISAQTTYTIVAALGNELSKYAQGERVEKVRLAASTGGPSTVTLITVSGKEYTLPSKAPAMPAS